MPGSTAFSENASPYINGASQADQPQSGLPLDRFLPPYYPDSMSAWLNHFAPPGSVVLDPFGQDPYVCLELARAGYRVVVSANNPIAALILEVMASAPTAEELSEAAHVLAGIKSADGVMLEDQINAYYGFECPLGECQKLDPKPLLQVDYLVWAEGAQNPDLVVGVCPHCGKHAEYRPTAEMLATQAPLPSLNLLRARLLELTASPGDPLRELMADVIAFYPHRALASLQAMLSRLENPILTSRQRLLLKALILTTADRVNQLWTHPGGRNRPRQLLCPPLYQEINAWQALLASIRTWSQTSKSVSLREWPNLPPMLGGISLFRGRLRELDPPLAPDLVDAVLTSLPRRNQAWWNLSGLWSSWLWGKTGSNTLRNSLLKQRYDWTWHSTALQKVLTRLAKIVPAEVPVLLQTTELDPMFALSGLLAARNAGLSLRHFAADGDLSVLQTAWRFSRDDASTPSITPLPQAVELSGVQFLKQIGEPSSYLRLLCAVLFSALQSGMLRDRPKPTESLNDLLEEINRALSNPTYFTRFNQGAAADTGMYWLVDASSSAKPLADRAEQAVLEALQSQPILASREVRLAVNRELPGLQNVSSELIQAILESYADPTPDHKAWSLREQESAALRANDLATIRSLLQSLALRLNFNCKSSAEVISWLDENDQPEYSFFPLVTAEFSKILIHYQDLPGRKLIILPGSRSNLAALKLKRDPRLMSLKTESWSLIKFRQLRNLSDIPLITRNIFASQINSDPPEYRSTQLALF